MATITLGKCKLSLLFVGAAFLANCSQGAPGSEDLFLVSSDADTLSVETTNRISSSEAIKLGEDQRIVVADTAGRIHKIKGPFEGAIADVIEIPESTESGEQMWQALDDFLGAGRLPQSRSPGATRDVGDDDIWDLHLSAIADKSTHCIPEASFFEVKRQVNQPDRGAVLQFSSPNGRKNSFIFPDQQDSVRVNSGSLSSSSYTINLDGVDILTLDFKRVANGTRTDLGLRLKDAGCTIQFANYLESLR